MTSEATRTLGNASRAVADRPGADPAIGRAGTIAPTSTGRRPVIDTPNGTFEFAPHHCFACGTLNAGGLGLELHVEPGRSWVELALEPRFEGWEGVVHGGILCTILDEVMAWALVGADDWGVTARMAVDFRKPVTVGLPIRAEGWITERSPPGRRHGRSHRRCDDRRRARDRDRRLRRGQRGPEARPPRSLRIPPDRAPETGDAATVEPGPPDTVDGRSRDRHPGSERSHRPRRRVRGRPSRRRGGARHGPRRVHQRPRWLRGGADEEGSRAWPIRRTSTASSGSRPASARSTVSGGP